MCIRDSTRNRGVWGELPVHLFRGFVRRILYSAVDDNGHGLPPRIPIDHDELPLKRSLISQVLLQLLATNKLKAFAPLAGREGCVNSVATLVGEIERAAKTPAELIEILRNLIPRVPDVVVNLNHDDSNPEIFIPFQETIGQLQSMATFDTVHAHDYTSPLGLLSQLRENLFNPLRSSDDVS